VRVSEVRSELATGVAYAVAAYGLWGAFPIYWRWIGAVPASEVIAPRIAWTALVMLATLAFTRRTRELAAGGFGRPRVFAGGAAAIALATNWLVFIYAIEVHRIVDTSLGYYINPLVAVLLGLAVLGERLSRGQAIAVGIAGVGVAYLTISTGSLPWISAVLAVSFALYGLAHKLAPQPPLGGLAFEMLLLAPLAIGWWCALASRGDAVLASAPASLQSAVALSGVITAVPLLCFHAAARRLPFVVVGMFQFISPTLTLVLAVWLYDEPFTRAHAISFGCVWIGLALFCSDALRRSPRL
jgi:chloramphenicol-sensitive protein RarD